MLITDRQNWNVGKWARQGSLTDMLAFHLQVTVVFWEHSKNVKPHPHPAPPHILEWNTPGPHAISEHLSGLWGRRQCAKGPRGCKLSKYLLQSIWPKSLSTPSSHAPGHHRKQRSVLGGGPHDTPTHTPSSCVWRTNSSSKQSMAQTYLLVSIIIHNYLSQTTGTF